MARCRVNTDSGTRTVARTAAALNKAGRRFTILPIVADSRTSARTRGLRTAAKRAKAVAGSGLWSTKVGQDRGVLQPLAAALAQMRAHRVRGVANHDDRTSRPHPRLLAIIQVIPQQDGGVRRC